MRGKPTYTLLISGDSGFHIHKLSKMTEDVDKTSYQLHGNTIMSTKEEKVKTYIIM